MEQVEETTVTGNKSSQLNMFSSTKVSAYKLLNQLRINQLCETRSSEKSFYWI